MVKLGLVAIDGDRMRVLYDSPNFNTVEEYIGKGKLNQALSAIKKDAERLNAYQSPYIYYIADEPDRSRAEGLALFKMYLEGIDPEHPAAVVFIGEDNIEVLSQYLQIHANMIDIHPLRQKTQLGRFEWGGKDMGDYIDWVKSQSSDTPLWLVAQSFGNNDGAYEWRRPSPAEFLSTHRKVAEVRYAGLKSYPGYKTAVAQMRGFSGMLGFQTVPGANPRKFQRNLRRYKPWASLGDVQTLAILRDEEKKRGIPPNFIRLSIGLEDPEDIIADLKNALDRA